jgi:hypothetical protein
VNARDVHQILERAGIPHALIGAAAVTLRGHSRSTLDTDFLTTDHSVFRPSLWKELVDRGEPVDIRKGDWDDPLAGVIRIGPPSDQVDVIVGKWKWEQEVINRSESMNAFGESVRVATGSDLILLKLAAGGYKDLVDAASLLSLGPRERIVAEVNGRVADLPAKAQAEWVKMLDATP